MVRQYREELFCQTTSNDVPLRFVASSANKFLKSEEVNGKKKASIQNEEFHAKNMKLKDKRHVYWHDSLIGTTCSIMQEVCLSWTFNLYFTIIAFNVLLRSV